VTIQSSVCVKVCYIGHSGGGGKGCGGVWGSLRFSELFCLRLSSLSCSSRQAVKRFSFFVFSPCVCLHTLCVCVCVCVCIHCVCMCECLLAYMYDR
jgi:hypothetical protein